MCLVFEKMSYIVFNVRSKAYKKPKSHLFYVYIYIGYNKKPTAIIRRLNIVGKVFYVEKHSTLHYPL